MKEILFRISAIVTGVAVSIILCEIILRILGIGYGNAPIESDPLLHHKHPSNYTFRVHTPSKEYGGHLIHYDAEGNSSNPDKIGQSSDDSAEIIVMGDSFVEAAQVPYRESFVGLMESCGGRIVKNYGVSSYSPLLFLLQWRSKVDKHAPSYVFVLLFSNDVGDDEGYASKAIVRNGEIVAVPGPGNDGLVRLLRQSYLIRFLRKLQLQIEWLIKNRYRATEGVIGGYIEESPEIKPLTEKALLTLRDEVKSVNGKLVLMAVPSKYRLENQIQKALKSEFSDVVKVWAGEHDIDFVDLYLTKLRLRNIETDNLKVFGQ